MILVHAIGRIFGFLFLMMVGGEPKEVMINTGILKGEKASDTWIVARHPELGITFEAPKNTYVQYGYPYAVGPDLKSGEEIKTHRFGIRELHRGGASLFALEWAFFIVTNEYRGVKPGDLDALPHRLGDTEFTYDFIRRVFFTPKWPAQLSELGDTIVGDRRGRRFSYLAGSEKVIGRPRGEIILVPLDGQSALVICSTFSKKILPEEEEILFPKIVRSVRVLEQGEGAPLVH